MSASVSPARSSAARGRGHRADAHASGRHAGDRPGDQPGQRPQPELGGPLAGGHEADRGAVVLPAGVARRDRRVGVLRPHAPGCSAASVSSVVSARGCSSRSTTRRRPCRPRTVTGTISSAKRPSSLRRDRPLVRAQRQLVLLLARDRVLAAQVLGGLEHPAGHRVVAAARGDPAAGEPVGSMTLARRGAPAHAGRSSTRPGSCSPRRRRSPGPAPRSGPASRRRAPPAAPSRSAGRSGARRPSTGRPASSAATRPIAGRLAVG